MRWHIAGRTWFDAGARVGLGHRRLAIVDLSEAGSQPMHSTSSRYVVVFNGEIYNFGELRGQLAALGHCFRGESDTEVMLAAIEIWGLREAVTRFIGMFAFALWDRNERRLSLVHDRIGKKPLYYSADGRTLLFSSELGALRYFPHFEGQVDTHSVATMLRYSYIPAPASIFTNVRKLPAGSILSCEVRDAALGAISIERYWSPTQVQRDARSRPFSGSYQKALEQLGELVFDAARRRMRAVAKIPMLGSVAVFVYSGALALRPPPAWRGGGSPHERRTTSLWPGSDEPLLSRGADRGCDWCGFAPGAAARRRDRDRRAAEDSHTPMGPGHSAADGSGAANRIWPAGRLVCRGPGGQAARRG
ncbi:MAG: asparagine synthetase B family protein [Gammaproteobacteria bacterium]